MLWRSKTWKLMNLFALMTGVSTFSVPSFKTITTQHKGINNNDTISFTSLSMVTKHAEKVFPSTLFSPASIIERSFLISTALAFLVLTTIPQEAMATSNTAGQISINSVPPTTIEINAKDIPVVGNIISGTYMKLDKASTKEVGTPSISISSPKSTIKAVQAAVTSGHVELDLNGLLSTHLDVDVASNENGVLNAKVASPLIPKLPFKNAASGDYCVSVSGKKTDWYKVVNLGDGDPYYYNSKTGATQIEFPDKL